MLKISNKSREELERIIKIQERKIKKLEYKAFIADNSRIWQLRNRYSNMINKYPAIKYLFRFLMFIFGNGFVGLIKKMIRFVLGPIRNFIYWIQIKSILLGYNKSKEIYVLLSPVEWNLSLFQRTNHIANNIARLGHLYFFVSRNQNYEVKGFKKLENNLYLTNQYELIARQLKHKFILQIYSTETRDIDDIIKEHQRVGGKVLYEYVDEISEAITNDVPDKVIKRHIKLMKNSKVYVIATADKLFKDVKIHRKMRLALITNGVEIDDFNVTDKSGISPKYLKFVKKHKKIIGYYGALASWFDYTLIEEIAKKFPQYGIVLIGPDYDGSLGESNYRLFKNIFWLGPIKYKNLPKYASYFDIATIPFLINEITESTSPLKIFEYMALSKPIITTNMPEARKYKSVFVAKTHKEFIDNIPLAIGKIADESYLKLLFTESHQNTWQKKAEDTIRLLSE